MIKCSKCSYEGPRGVMVQRQNGSLVEFCNVHKPRQIIDQAKNPFQNFTLDHVRDERGQKVKVNSISELRAAEKRYNFALAVASDDGGKADKPPNHESWAGDITHGYTKKWQKDPEAYKPDNITGVSAGIAKDQSGTLADHPNPV